MGIKRRDDGTTDNARSALPSMPSGGSEATPRFDRREATVALRRVGYVVTRVLGILVDNATRSGDATAATVLLDQVGPVCETLAELDLGTIEGGQ